MRNLQPCLYLLPSCTLYKVDIREFLAAAMAVAICEPPFKEFISDPRKRYYSNVLKISIIDWRNNSQTKKISPCWKSSKRYYSNVLAILIWTFAPKRNYSNVSTISWSCDFIDVAILFFCTEWKSLKRYYSNVLEEKFISGFQKFTSELPKRYYSNVLKISNRGIFSSLANCFSNRWWESSKRYYSNVSEDLIWIL